MLIAYLSVFLYIPLQKAYPGEMAQKLIVLVKIFSGFAIFFTAGVCCCKKYSIDLKMVLFSEKQRPLKIALLSLISFSLGIISIHIRATVNGYFQLKGTNYGWHQAAFATEDIFWIMVPIWFIHAIGEELFFRGFVFNYLKKNYSFSINLILSSLIFSAVHIPHSLSHGLFLFLHSLFITYTYQHFKLLLYPVLVHATLNSYAHYATIQGPDFFKWLMQMIDKF